jgi:hypothetical protein
MREVSCAGEMGQTADPASLAGCCLYLQLSGALVVVQRQIMSFHEGVDTAPRLAAGTVYFPWSLRAIYSCEIAGSEAAVPRLLFRRG